MGKPNRPGWHWFLPADGSESPIPTLRWRTDTPIILYVEADKVTRDMPPARLVVRFGRGMFYVDDMPGDWEWIPTPVSIRREVRRRFLAREVQ